jgi:hypothetical protein
MNHDRLRNTPPKKKAQNPNELSRGKATSRAPICKGTR